MKPIITLRNFALQILPICTCLNLMLACKPTNDSQNELSKLKIFPANGRVISLDTMPPLETLPIGKIETVPLGKPTEVSIPNYSKSIEWKTVIAGNPMVYTLGKDTVLIPKTVPAIHKPVPAGKPTINIAKAPVSREYNPFNLTFLTMNEGLIESQIHNLFQDKKGNIWLGTFNGISKYNGHTFENFNRKSGLVDNFFETGIEDHEGNIWLGFRGGVTKYDGENFTNYTSNEGLSGNSIFKILEDSKNNIWFATKGNGVTMLDKDRKTFTHFGSKQGVPAAVFGIVEDKKGNIWFATENGDLIKYDFRSFSAYTTNEGLPNNSLLDLTNDASGHLWMTTWTGVVKFDGINFHHALGLLNNSWAGRLIVDRGGNIWFGGEPGGVCRIDKSGKTATNITTNEGLPDIMVMSAMEDHNGNIWFGTQKGAVKYSKLVSNLTQKDGLLNLSVSCVGKDNKQNIWVGTEHGGVSKIDFETNTIKSYTTSQGLTNNDITNIMHDQAGNTWVGAMFSNIVRFNADGKTLTHFRDSGTYVVCIFEDKAGNIWYSSRHKNGIFRMNKNDTTATFFSPKNGLPQGQVVKVWQDREENMWFCTFNGVSRLDKSGKTLTNFTEKEGFHFNVVESVIEDKHGNFWFTNLSDGVTCLNYKNKTFIHFTEKEGLSNNTAFGILEDKSGNLWFNTRIGLSKLPASAVQQLASANPLEKPVYFRNYNAEQGYLSFGAGRFDIVEDSSGKIWLPMVDRVTIFDPNQELVKAEKPTVELTNIKLYNEPIDWKKDTSFILKNGIKVASYKFRQLSKWNKLPEDLSLAYNNNYLNFEFVGINTNTPQKLIYQYILEGLEKTWSVPSARSEAVYGNLPTGNYVFKVKTMNSDGNWSDELAYSFTIRPPFWLTWWAYIVYALIIGSVIYAIINYRVEQGVRRVKALETIRTKISADLHDDVGSVLSGLAMQSQMLAFSAKEEQKESLLEISTMSHDAMERMRDTVWAIDSRKDKYENLIDRMRVFAERSLNMKQIKHTFKVEIEDSKKFINPEKRQNIYLILKEAITNICKHSDARNVEILFRQKKNDFYLLIYDDGSAQKKPNSDGLGMNNMRMRAKNINANLRISYGNGYKVELESKG
ncbi:sensor histidine kinase [Emticicia agri]|uniref:Two component regulator three Y domain-containing protein n=1 Tax=Emticicia agri TaxID=2492393 RepID=A0A4Q5LX66_9BACT|nr:sensor histidine kinase [Emticicia agri]RYU94411.1 hypothetical protein EWM59_17355 [Emticicia agri]